MPYDSLPSAAQTAYADLVDSLISAPPPDRGVNYFKRAVRGRDYWYIQQVVGSRKRSFYLGPDDEETRTLILNIKARRETDRGERPAREQLVSIGLAAGLWTPNAAEIRIYEALAQAGAFAIGGVLVGTHGFLNLGNALCVRWRGTAGRTKDIDVAHDPHLMVAAPPAGGDIEAELKRREPDFLPIPSLDSRHPSTGFSVRGTKLSVSLLTPEHGKPSDKPIWLPALRAAAEPVRFLDYLIEDSIVAAVPAGAGILIRVPTPGRFALHKLVLSQRRLAVMAAKARKDLEQASSLLEALLDLRPGDISAAAQAAGRCGGKFVRTMLGAVQLLPDELEARVRPLVK